MKYRMFTLILALSAAAWAQTATQNATAQSSTPATAKAECCCDKGAAKEAHSCCAHHDMNGKDMSSKDGKEAMSCGKDSESCCGGKDGMSCKHTAKDAREKEKVAASCADCMKNHEKSHRSSTSRQIQYGDCTWPMLLPRDKHSARSRRRCCGL